ncbi:MAG: hypothetical protein Crog4KO_36370 [Crocinitomicaceae bacterium]
MKTTATLIGLLIAATSFCQNTSKSSVSPASSTPVRETGTTTATPLPTAQVERIDSGSNLTYRFVSNRVLSDEQATRWETRFPTVYNEVIAISIDPQTQEVEIELPSTHNLADLDGMIARFGFSGYQISN